MATTNFKQEQAIEHSAIRSTPPQYDPDYMDFCVENLDSLHDVMALLEAIRKDDNGKTGISRLARMAIRKVNKVLDAIDNSSVTHGWAKLQ